MKKLVRILDLNYLFLAFQSKAPCLGFSFSDKEKCLADLHIEQGSEVTVAVQAIHIFVFLTQQTFSGQIGFWEHRTEASKMQGRARGRNSEHKKYLISI